jgi:hypothetical protein
LVETKAGGMTPALITMKSTQLNVSKKWNSMMKTIQIPDGKGGMAILQCMGLCITYNLYYKRTTKVRGMVGLLHKTELWDRTTNLYTLRQKILVVLPLKETCKQKLM